jgi:ParB family transcriptional regulator, chromosome partitioning protein
MPRGITAPNEANVVDAERLTRIATAAVSTRSSGLRIESDELDRSISELAKSISDLGIIEPIVVRRAEGGKFEVVAGERRLRAARILKWDYVPCIIRNCSDSTALLSALTENLQRADLTPIERAYGFQRLLEECGLTQDEIARRLCISQSAVAHHLRLLALPPEVKSQLHIGELSMGHGKLLASLDDQRAVIALAGQCVAKNLSVRELEDRLSSTARSKRSTRREHPGKVRKNELELPNGVFLWIKEKAGDACYGTIEIPFYSEHEKEWVLEVLRNTGFRKSVAGQDFQPKGQAQAE